MGGTLHLALGAAFPATGGTNQSAVHWDMILDLRTDGMVIADGKAIVEKGRVLI